MFRCVFSALLLVVSPIASRVGAAAADEGPELWEDDKLTEVQPFPAKVLAVESGWGGYRLLLESAGEGEGAGEKRYCFAQVWLLGPPHLAHLEYRETRKTELPKPGPMVYLDPPVAVSRFSWSMGPCRIGEVFGEEDCLKKAVAMEVKAGRGNATGKFIGLPEKAEAEPTSALPEGAVVHSIDGGETDPEKLKAIYERYTGSKFADIGQELAREMAMHPREPRPIIPVPGRDGGRRLGETLQKAWYFHMESADRPSDREVFDALMPVLEDAMAGPGRSLALSDIHSRLRALTKAGNGTVPQEEKETMRRLRAIAANEEERDMQLRREIVATIFENGDPNEVLDLAVELSLREGNPHAMTGAFLTAAPIEGTKRLTKEKRGKYLSHGFLLLGRIDDGKSEPGSGGYLAEHLGKVIGIEPLSEGQGPFGPDLTLPEYKGMQGFSMAYRQKSVEAAMAWWEEHRGEYE
jgi:hypothetical protein